MKVLVTGGTGFIGWRVTRTLLERGVPTVVGELNVDQDVDARLKGARMHRLDVSDAGSLEAIFREEKDITHCIHLAYLMSAEVEANPPLGARVNVLGTANVFEATVRHSLARLVYASSETFYGASQDVYGDRPVTEDDQCLPRHHFYTYGAMKVLNELMASKYVERHGASMVAVRPPVVFGHGRKRGSVLWAEAFASAPAVGKPVTLPFSRASRDTWVYVDDCAEQIVRLALKPSVSHAAYNNGGEAVTGGELAALVRRWLPDARIDFDESVPRTTLIDREDGSRLIHEIDFTPRPLADSIRAHINEARVSAGMGPV